MWRAKPYERLHRHWRSDPAWTTTIADADEADLVDLERRYRINLPADFREYLLHSAQTPNEKAEWPTEWWQIASIKSLSEEYEHPILEPVVAANADKYLVFADYMIWAQAWAIACTGDAHDGRVIVIGSTDRFVAHSFEEFVGKFIENVDALL